MTPFGNSTIWNMQPSTRNHEIWQGWVLAFIDYGNIDVEAPEFLDRLFSMDRNHTGVRVMVEMGMDPTATDSAGNTVLHVAARRNDLTLYRWLLQFDVDPDIRNSRGQTALDITRQRFARDPDRTPLIVMEQLLEEWRTDRRQP